MAELRPDGFATFLPRWAGRMAFVAALTALTLFGLAGATRAQAAVTCPNPIPVVNENECHTGTTSWEVNEYSPNLGGYTTKTSVNLGESVTLKIARNGPIAPTKTVNISVYRMGYYEGTGGRLVNSATNVAINNDYSCEPMNETFGEVSCANWQPTYTIPGSAFPASGVYLAKLKASTGEETAVVFTVREDNRATASKILFVLPVSDYEAYNTFGGKSLYWGYEGGNTVVTGTSRAAKVSFDRPLAQAGAMQNWFAGPDQDLLTWLEQQGYDVSYTDQLQVAQHPEELLGHKLVISSGHSEYWSEQEYEAFLKARAAGVNLATFGSNTTYWKVRYENNYRTLDCFKTVEGNGVTGSGAAAQNDWGPDGIKGTADDALGADGIAGTPDDNPQNSTTTWRDNGAPNGDPNAPPGGRVGPDKPENQLWGVMYVGDDDSRGFPVTVPPGNSNEEFASNRIWRNAGIPSNSTTNIGSMLVNWEWDAIPTQAQYASHEPAGVKRIYSTTINEGGETTWLQDEGRVRAKQPPPGQPNTVGGVEYKAASGARVFATGSMEWARGLTYEPDPRIQQATYNIFSTMGIQPNTPESGLTLDPAGSNQAPDAGFTISPNPAKTATPITFDASSSFDPDGTIAKYEWDLNGDGEYDTTTTKPTVTYSYAEEGTYEVKLRVTDNQGATDTTVRTLQIINNQPPTASFTATPSSAIKNETITFDGSASSDPDGTIAKYEWDLDGNGTYETSSGSSPTITHVYTTPGTYTVGLRVTDNGGKTSTTTRPISIGSGEVSKYSNSVLATPGLVHYWRMGETAGPTWADSKGSSPVTALGSPVFGVPGAVAEDPDRAAEFEGAPDAGSAVVNLANTHTLTVEFWLKWKNYSNDDALAMELTKNFNLEAGGFLIDPDAPQFEGTFGVGIGSGTSRNNVFFERPSAGTWHHYAFVINTQAPAAQEIIPYVDGKAVSYQKADSGTGAGNFASSTLYLMSRAGAENFGTGSLDEVALYNRALSATTISKHYNGIVVEGEEGSVGSAEAEKEPVEEGPPAGGSGLSYTDSVLATPGIQDYWSMGEPTGPTMTDSVGNHPATAANGAVFGAVGGVPGETGTSVHFDGVDDYASAPLTLGGSKALTIEFWMKWNQWANNDELAMEYTPNFNNVPGGFLIDPNSSYGNFAVATGIGASRNISLFARPSAGVWHHYAFVLNTEAPASEQIVPYVDGVPVTYTKPLSGTGAPAFANSTLYFMSRGGVELQGGGNLQDVGIFNQPLSAATISQNHASNGANVRPTASFLAPATVKAGETVEFNAAASKDPNGTIAKYEWDLDGNGSYETSTGTTPTVTHTFTTAGPVNVGLRVTDSNGNTGSTTRTVTVEGTGTGPKSEYRNAVLGTPGLLDYWRMDEASGSILADSAGTSPATMVGEPTLGVPGGVPGESDTAVGFDGVNDAATAALHLGGRTSLTVEFWLKWNAWANNDELAMEYTPNFNNVPGGFLIDPNSSYGSFAVGIGNGASRNVALFARPRAGVWHHYAFVLDTTAPASEEIIPYVDGQEVAHTQAASGTGAPAFANSTLSFMSRAGAELFGAGDLDDVSIYGRPLSATTIANHFQGIATNQAPTASLSAPATVKAGEAVQLDASASSDPDGSISHYEWDLDGDGEFEASTGSTPTISHTFSKVGETTVRVRVTDNEGATAIASKTITVQPGSGGEVGGGGGEVPTTSTYRETVMATPSLLDYWRLGEQSGSVFADSAGSGPATMIGAPTLGVSGAIVGDSNTAAGFDGVKDAATAPLHLSGRTSLTVEFWLKWNAWANNDELAMEYTPNFNNVPGGFLIDPNSSYGSFAVGIGLGSSRNVSLFARPTAGVWHHYAFVLKTEAPASEQVVPYVDGKAVAYTKAESGTGAAPFADATLSFMSRAGAELFGAGDLDDVSIYGEALTPATIAGHFAAGEPNHPPTASFSVSPNPAPTGSTVTFNASASNDSDGTIASYEWDLDGNGTYETNTGTEPSVTSSYPTAGEKTIGLRVTDDRGATATTTRSLTIQNRPPVASFTATPSTVPTGSTIALDASGSSDPDGTVASYEWDLDGNGSYETSTGTNPTASTSFATPGTRAIGLRVTDNNGATSTTTRTVTVQNRPPSATFTATPNPVVSGQTVNFDASGSADPDGTIVKYEWDLDGNGTYETSGTSPTASHLYANPGEKTIGLRVTDNSGATETTTRTLTVQNRPPTASFTATPTTAPTGTQVALNAAASSDPDGTIAKYEWDLDGNGTYETTTTTPTTTTSFAKPGTYTIGLRVTDNSGATSTTTQTVTAQNRAPVASFTATPNPAPTGTTVTFSAAASNDPDGTIAKYEWDLDGNGTYETNTGTTPSASRSYTSVGEVKVGLRVTDNNGATSTTTQTVTIQNRPPVPSFTITPNPAVAGSAVTFSAAASSDPDGTIAKYEWDLDGNGTYETSSTLTSKATHTYSTAGQVNVTLRVTDNRGATATLTQPVTIRGSYNNAVLGTAGLLDYWRLGEPAGSTSLADSIGGLTATAFNGVALGTAGNLSNDPDTAATFDGTNDYASVPINLSATSKLTIEFWLKWTAFANDDRIALELTPNFNNTNGGFLINPDSSTSSSRFEVALGRGTSRNNAYFTRPTANAWHHYAFVLNTTAIASQQILAYVDGKAVTVTKGSSGTGAGNFANSTLYLMSRGGTSLFGKGTLDELSIYNQALTATQIAQQYAAR